MTYRISTPELKNVRQTSAVLHWKLLLAAAAAAALLPVSGLLAPLSAQGAPKPPAATKATVPAKPPAAPKVPAAPPAITSNNACASISVPFSISGGTPEGVAVARIQWELDSARRAVIGMQLKQQLVQSQVEAAMRQQQLTKEAVERQVESALRQQRAVLESERAQAQREVARMRIDELRLKMIDSLLGKLDERNTMLFSSPVTVWSLRGDSLARVFRGDSVFKLLRGDSLTRVFSADSFRVLFKRDSLNVLVRNLNDSIRVLQPQIKMMLTEANRFRSMSPLAGPGYIGISTSGSQVRVLTPDGMLTSHCDYPVVEAVDAGSPAQRAGVARGDTLLAYNGKDVKKNAVNYNTLLTPGRDVKLTLQNSGRTRDATVRVEGRVQPSVSATFSGSFPSSVRAGSRISEFPLSSSSSVVNIAGAQFVTMDADLASALGVGVGVLALRVPTGSTAAGAGLKTGDVVHSVNGEPVRDAVSLQRLLSGWTNGGGSQARLVVQSRTGGERTLVLKLR